jgi:effector-binding domain-containing protein
VEKVGKESPMLSEPKLEQRPAQPYVAIRTAVSIPFGKHMPPLWNKVTAWLFQQGVTDFGPAIIRYLTTDMTKKLDIEVGFLVNQPLMGDSRVFADELPAGRYATLLYTGPYRGNGVFKANVALIGWAKDNQIVWNTSDRNGAEWWGGRAEIYLTDPDKEKNTRKYQTELAFLVAD